jgi:hypothetical protein
MSFSAHRRDALDGSKPLAHRLSHARSCAMLLGQKYKVPRSAILLAVRDSSGVDLTCALTEEELIEAVRHLSKIKTDGFSATQE